MKDETMSNMLRINRVQKSSDSMMALLSDVDKIRFGFTSDKFASYWEDLVRRSLGCRNNQDILCVIDGSEKVGMSELGMVRFSEFAKNTKVRKRRKIQ